MLASGLLACAQTLVDLCRVAIVQCPTHFGVCNMTTFLVWFTGRSYEQHACPNSHAHHLMQGFVNQSLQLTAEYCKIGMPRH